MRWSKFIVILLLLVGGVYVGVMYSLEEKKTIVVEREVAYPVDKVFPQFENFQQFTRWSGIFQEKEKYSFRYFLPYEGEGSAMSFVNINDNAEAGDIFIREVKSLKSIRYEIYQKGEKQPYKMAVNFLPKGEKTKITWKVETSTIPLMMRFMTLSLDDKVETSVANGIKRLSQLLSGKVDTEVRLSQIKYDSIIIEEQEPKILLGINITAMNKKGALQKSIVMHHHKLMNFVSKDLAKREDEYGMPTLITEVGGLKNKEISYFYGISLPKKEQVSDYNFVFKEVGKSQLYSIYYKGNYEGRHRAIAKLLAEIKKAERSHGQMEELFIEPPMEGSEVLLKISFPVD